MGALFMIQCLHGTFEARCEVYRLTDDPPHPENAAKAFTADLRIRCADCGEAFLFLGLGIGSFNDRPSTNYSQTEIRMAIEPSGTAEWFEDQEREPS